MLRRLLAPSDDTVDALRELWPYWHRHMGLLITAGSCIVCSSLLNIMLPLIGRSIAQFEGDDAVVLGLRTLLGVVCIAAYHAISFYGHYRAHVGGRAVESSLQKDAVRAATKRDFAALAVAAPAQHTSAIDKGTAVVASITGDVLTDGIHDLISTVGYFVMVCYISVTLTATFVSVVVATQVFSKWYKAKRRASGDDVVLRDGQAKAILISAFQRAALTRIFPGAEAFLLASFDKHADLASDAQRHLIFSVHSNAAFTSGVTNSVFMTLVGVLCYAKAQGLITTMDIALFFFYIVQLQNRLQGVANHYNRSALLLQQTSELRALMRHGLEDETKRAAHAVDTRRLTGPVDDAVAVRFEEVTYRYPSETSVDGSDAAAVDRVNLVIARNKITAVVGRSGSGKSTIMRLIAGLLPAQQGRVHRSERDAVAMLEQQPALLLGTISDNIRVARPAATDAEVQVAASYAGCADFISALPEGYQTVIRNTDIAQFSGGQLQRICLARVFLSRASIVVFDEPTTGLDPNAAEAITKAMIGLRDAGRTVIMVTHNMSHAALANEVIMVQHGKVTAQGPYHEGFAS